MKSLISVNFKFMDISPKKLIELINTSKYTKGIEICVDNYNKREMKYFNDLVYELKRNDLILQVHGNIALDIDEQVRFLSMLETYSDYLGYPIVVTFHTLYHEDKNISLSETIDYLSNVFDNIDSSKIIVSLENLNDILGLDRLNKDDIRKTILNDEKIYFTYDIGHEIADHGNITDLDKYMIDDIRNVHIHTYDKLGNDHMPIYKNDEHWLELLKAIELLKLNNYKYNIVFEYGLDLCYGENIEEQVKDYLSSIDLVSERF